MRLPTLRHLLLPLFAALLLSACHGKDDLGQPGGSTPVAALQGSLDLLKADNLKGLWKHALPPADYANLRHDWNRHAHQAPPPSAADQARFNQAMQQLTAPDAQTRLYTELQPKLAAMQQKYQDQLPVLISIGEAFLKHSITQSATLDTNQKAQANSVLDVITPWAKQAAWFDQAKARQAVDVTVTTARKLDLKTSAQWRAMDFDTAMGKYGTGYAGLKQLLAIYGLSVDDTLDSVKLTQLSSSNGHAVVRIDYTLLGKPLSTESTLVQENGRWYSEDLLNNVRASHKKLDQPPTPAASTAIARVSAANG